MSTIIDVDFVGEALNYETKILMLWPGAKEPSARRGQC